MKYIFKIQTSSEKISKLEEKNWEKQKSMKVPTKIWDNDKIVCDIFFHPFKRVENKTKKRSEISCL